MGDRKRLSSFQLGVLISNLEPPPLKAFRTLVLISKLLQNLANNVLFSQKETYMIPLNEFYEKNQEKMAKFLDTVSLLKEKKSPNEEESNASPGRVPKRPRNAPPHSPSISPRETGNRLTVGSVPKTRIRSLESITTSASVSDVSDPISKESGMYVSEKILIEIMFRIFGSAPNVLFSGFQA
jgi:hypothetical protein